MASEAELNAGIAKFKIDLSEFAGAMKRLVRAAIGAMEKEQARAAMKEMIEESAKTFETIVQTLAPFYALTNDKQFANAWVARYGDFKALYLRRQHLARTHCTIVEQEFANLHKRRSWMAHLPVAQTAYADLERVCDGWLFQDWSIVGQTEAFLGNLDRFMAEIAVLNQADSKRAYQAFSAGLKSMEADFLAMKTELGELEALSRRI